MKTALPFLFLLIPLALHAAGATPDYADDNDFSPLCFALACVFGCILLVVIGLCLGIGLITVLCGAVLAGLGLVSSSVFIGLVRKRFLSGLRAFHYQVIAALGFPAGIFAMAMGRWLFSMHMRGRDVVLIGSIAGVCGGLLFAFLLDHLAAILVRRIKPLALRARRNG